MKDEHHSATVEERELGLLAARTEHEMEDILTKMYWTNPGATTQAKTPPSQTPKASKTLQEKQSEPTSSKKEPETKSAAPASSMADTKQS